MRQALVNATVHTGTERIQNGVIVVDNGKVETVCSLVPQNCALIDLGGMNISAGFIDIHINGGEEFYFSQHPTEAAIRDIYESSLQYGTTQVLPCLISSPAENILQGIEAIKNYREKYQDGVLGMHLEGPFINPIKRGAHLASEVRKPTNAELNEILKYGKGVITLMTIAPECFTDDQLDLLLQSGITIAAGHSNMNYQQAQYYFDKGIRLVTHLYNAMTQFGHREPGLVGATFANDQVYAPIILDGVHCDYAAAKIAYRQKKDKLILISDALFLSRKKQQFVWGEFNATLQNGFYRNSEGNLAASTISMAEAVRNAVLHVGVPVNEAIQMATSRVAGAIGLQDKIGHIAPGYPATFVQFTDDLSIIQSLVL